MLLAELKEHRSDRIVLKILSADERDEDLFKDRVIETIQKYGNTVVSVSSYWVALQRAWTNVLKLKGNFFDVEDDTVLGTRFVQCRNCLLEYFKEKLGYEVNIRYCFYKIDDPQMNSIRLDNILNTGFYIVEKKPND